MEIEQRERAMEDEVVEKASVAEWTGLPGVALYEVRGLESGFRFALDCGYFEAKRLCPGDVVTVLWHRGDQFARLA